MVLFCFTVFFANFGPNATTFVVPAEIFPTSWRTTAHGISAACGKAGAILGTYGFLYASQPLNAADAKTDPAYNSAANLYGIGFKGAFGMLAGVCGLGIFTTLLIPEPMGKSLEEITNEKEALNGTH